MRGSLRLLLIFLAAVGISFAQSTGPGAPGTNAGGPPTGAASGCLNGTYPGPGLSQTCIENQTGVVLANSFSGSDIGAKITNAIAALPLNIDNVPVGTVTLNGTSSGSTAVYDFSTAVVFPRSVKLECNGAYLVWQGSNSAAVFTWAGSDTNPFAAGGTSDCNLISQALITDGDPAFVPSIATIAVDAAGTGYSVGDIVSVLKSTATLGTAVVTSTSASPGPVTGVSVLHGGYAYAPATGLSTSPITGSGSGLTVTITTNAVESCYPYNATPTLPSAIFLGGDPTSTIVPSADYGSFETFTNTRIAGFCGAILGGNNTWANNYFNVSLDDNYWGIDDEQKSQVNAGERSTFHGGKIYDNVGANLRLDGGSQFTFDGTNIDYSEQLDGSSRWVGGAPIVGNWIESDFESVHIEDKYAPVIAEYGGYKSWISLTNGDIYVAASPNYSTAYFGIAGTEGAFHANSVLFDAGQTVPYWFSNPTNGAYLDNYNPVQGPIGIVPTAFSTTGQTLPIAAYRAINNLSVQPFIFTEQQSFSVPTVAEFLQPSAPNGAIVTVEVGVDASSNDCTQITENFTASGSGSNYGALRMCGSSINAAQWNSTGLFVTPNGLKVEGVNSPITAISTATSTSSVEVITAPNLNATQEISQQFGVDGTALDEALAGFHYAGSGSTGNYAFFDLNGLGGTHAIEVLGTGAISLNFATTSPNFVSNVATGTQPYATTSTTLNTNLNANFVGGIALSGLCQTGGTGCPAAAVTSVFGRVGPVTAQTGDYTVAQVTGAAPLASPALTGTPTAPTQSISTNNTDIATTGAVTSALGSYVLTSSLGTFATQNYATPPAIGGTTPAAGSFTSINGTGTHQLIGGTTLQTSNSATTPLTVNNTTTPAANLAVFKSAGVTITVVNPNGVVSGPGMAGSETVASSATPTFSTAFRVSQNVLTANVTSFTLAAGADGQEKCLDFTQGSGSYTVTAPANVHGFFSVGFTSGKDNVQCFLYRSTATAWVAESTGAINE